MKAVYTFAVSMLAVGPALNSPALAKDVCLQRHDIDGWGTRDSHELVVSDRFGKKYLLSLVGWCEDLDFSIGVAFPSRFANGFSCLERGDRVVARDFGEWPRTHAMCTIAKIDAYTPEMEKTYREAKAAAKAAKIAKEAEKNAALMPASDTGPVK